jgi:hypothetical protein
MILAFTVGKTKSARLAQEDGGASAAQDFG